MDECNKILHQVLQQAVDCDINLNYDKFQFCVSEVKYLGTIITHEEMKPDSAKGQSHQGDVITKY